MSLDTLFSPNGPLALAFESFEPRPQQIEMASAIERAVADQQHLLVEAGTGTGKSLAYLVPLVQWAVRAKKRVIVSTFTKALQNQLITKDLPFLKRALSDKFTYALCLGTSNYHCPRRQDRAEEGGLLAEISDLEQLLQIRRWSQRSRTGIQSDLDFVPKPSVWSMVNRDPDLCNGPECRYYDDCPYYAARRRQYAAEVLVANHHLFFANLASGGNVLPPFDAVLLDEAHNLEEVAAEFLGLGITNGQLDFLFDSVLNTRTGRGLVSTLDLPVELSRSLEDTIVECHVASDSLFAEVTDYARQATGRYTDSGRVSEAPTSRTLRIREADCLLHHLEEPLGHLAGQLRDLKKLTSDEEVQFEIESLALRSDRFNTALRDIISHTRPNHVYWANLQASPGPPGMRARRGERISLSATPIDLSDLMRESLFERYRPIILTSATLTTNGSFDYLKARLGVHDANSLAVGSPFDFARQAILYLASHLPDPSRRDGAFEGAAIQQAAELLAISEGGAFVLCTSYQMVRRTHEVLSRLVENGLLGCKGGSLRIIRQGEMPRERLLKQFKANPNSVLVGTATFWQGIDVPGEALRCVILMRLPFAVPDDPITEARIEHLQLQGIDPFTAYQLPRAVILMRQGFGRLIRTRDDYGLVAILDPRIRTRFYGRVFLTSLPPCRQTDNPEEVRAFFAARRGGSC